MSRFLKAEINLQALIDNFNTIKSYLKSKQRHTKIIAVVKADAYGHGAEEVSKALETQGVDFLGVAFFEEALALRESGIKSPILLLFDREINGVFEQNLIPVIFDLKQAQELSKEAVRRGRVLPVHLKIETGMGRMGIHGDIFSIIEKIASLENIKIEGIMSHLSEAENQEWTMSQVKRFREIKEWAERIGINACYHIANSAGLLYEKAIFDAVRPGIALYGYGLNSSAGEKNPISLKPSMTVKSKLLDIRRLPRGVPISYGRTYVTERDSIIGVVPIGYADGYLRSLSNRAYMIVRGKKAPVIGRVCMDLTMIDLTEIREAEVDDEVIILGNSGDALITADDLAQWAGTISYEVLTSLGNRAKKKYIKGGKEDDC